MIQTVIALLSAFIGSLGFALIHNHVGVDIFFASLGGALTWGVFLLGGQFFANLFLINLLAAAFAALYSEIMARFRKLPATVFVVTSIIPLVPGSGLYDTLLGILEKNEQTPIYAVNTLLTAAGIAAGIVLISVLVKGLSSFLQTKK